MFHHWAKSRPEKDTCAQDEIPKNISHQNWARSCPEKTFVAQDKKPY